jgi:hypothetical protein
MCRALSTWMLPCPRMRPRTLLKPAVFRMKTPKVVNSDATRKSKSEVLPEARLCCRLSTHDASMAPAMPSSKIRPRTGRMTWHLHVYKLHVLRLVHVHLGMYSKLCDKHDIDDATNETAPPCCTGHTCIRSGGGGAHPSARDQVLRSRPTKTIARVSAMSADAHAATTPKRATQGPQSIVSFHWKSRCTKTCRPHRLTCHVLQETLVTCRTCQQLTDLFA